ncbi:MAG: GAF domain-containing sensor histidine kinase [Candidatus Omnitrophica bacterium]|nr:GAF domain-containing sensor histidine kinase [Candidatus Omnitrophota bacterium]MBU1997231.1 GAF domain-containing sensor histidine kinase [Candidatus Omnitrophota bacterium]MBU4333468.1 GAF domain-containing sensor histidine kinase [Candidatus Omnitrophota bacterium]
MALSRSFLDDLSKEEFLEKVNVVCSLVDYIVDEQGLLTSSLEKTMRLFGASRGSIFIYDEEKGTLNLKVSLGMELSDRDGIEKVLGSGIVGKVAELKRPIIVEDISKDKRFKDYKARKSYKTPSFICAPLIIKDELVGVICLADKYSDDMFYENELTLIDFLASQIALNYKRVNLYKKFDTMVDESKELKYRIGQIDTEKKTLKKQIYVQEKFATIGKLAGGIAHEFNNPLDGVLRYTNLCLENAKDDEVVRGYLLEIKHGLNRMIEIVRSLIACSRNELLGNETVELKGALSNSIKNVQSDILNKDIAIVHEIADDIPALPNFGLERILDNLLRNAIYAVEDKGEIKIKAFVSDNILEIVVSDTGRGIAEKDIKSIFEPFFTTKDISKGCGLGLTIVYEIVKCYNGRINVESSVSEGTVFTVEIPVEGNNGQDQ